MGRQEGRLLETYLDYDGGTEGARKRVGRSKKLAELALADVQVKLERKELGFAQTDKKLDELISEYLEAHPGFKWGRGDQCSLMAAALEKFKGLSSKSIA